MGVGLPSSGKTTTLKDLADKHGYVYASPDMVRRELLGNEGDQSRLNEVWDIVHTRVAEALERGETVVLDSTHVNVEMRRNFIQFAKDHGAEKVQGVYMNVPLEIADERNQKRERVVPRFDMERMNKMLEDAPPRIEDGFDSLFSLNEFQQLEEVGISKSGETTTKEFHPKLR